MEKRTPHYRLATIKALIRAGKVIATASATAGARAVGIRSMQGMCDVITSLRTADFYKSMTTYANHLIWQDVYRGTAVNGTRLYIKLMVLDGVLIISFKEL